MTNFITKAAVAAVVAIGALGAAAQANAAQVDVIVKTPKVVVHKPVVVVKPVKKVVIKPATKIVIKPTPIVVHKPVVVVKPAPVVIVKPAPVVVLKGGRCAPALALQKASNQGLNKVAVSFVGPNRITVQGKTHGVWAKISFANVNGCPRL